MEIGFTAADESFFVANDNPMQSYHESTIITWTRGVCLLPSENFASFVVALVGLDLVVSAVWVFAISSSATQQPATMSLALFSAEEQAAQREQ
jgi:hypothetical protein